MASFYYIASCTRLSFFTKCITGAVIITGLELILGIWFNIILKENVWDYSNMPLNFMGQICLPFSALWLIASGAVFKAIDYLKLSLYAK